MTRAAERRVVSSAAKVLRSKTASAADKSVAASALTQRPAGQRTAPKVASAAARVLKDRGASRNAKSAAASALTQKTQALDEMTRARDLAAKTQKTRGGWAFDGMKLAEKAINDYFGEHGSKAIAARLLKDKRTSKDVRKVCAALLTPTTAVLSSGDAERRLMAVGERLAALYQKLGAGGKVTAKVLDEILSIEDEVEKVAKGDA